MHKSASLPEASGRGEHIDRVQDDERRIEVGVFLAVPGRVVRVSVAVIRGYGEFPGSIAASHTVGDAGYSS